MQQWLFRMRPMVSNRLVERTDTTDRMRRLIHCCPVCIVGSLRFISPRLTVPFVCWMSPWSSDGAARHCSGAASNRIESPSPSPSHRDRGTARVQWSVRVESLWVAIVVSPASFSTLILNESIGHTADGAGRAGQGSAVQWDGDVAVKRVAVGSVSLIRRLVCVGHSERRWQHRAIQWKHTHNTAHSLSLHTHTHTTNAKGAPSWNAPFKPALRLNGRLNKEISLIDYQRQIHD